MRGVVTHPNGTTKNFTIRHDYDFALGLPSAGGKGYHVNVELPNEKYAYCSPPQGESNFADRVQMLSQRRLHDGDDGASKWLMDTLGK